MVGYDDDPGVVIDAQFAQVIHPLAEAVQDSHVALVMRHLIGGIHVHRDAVQREAVRMCAVIFAVLYNVHRLVIRLLQRDDVMGGTVLHHEELVLAGILRDSDGRERTHDLVGVHEGIHQRRRY